MIEIGKKIILNLLDRTGYSLLRKRDLNRHLEDLNRQIEDLNRRNEDLNTLNEDLNRRNEDTEKRLESALRHQFLFSHAMMRGRSPIKYAFVSTVEPTEADTAIALRLLRFYQTCMEEKAVDRQPKGDLWGALQTAFHAEFLNLLSRNDPEPLAAYLCNMCCHPATHGVLQGASVYNQLLSDESSRQEAAVLILDKLVCLAEALGCLSRENPEGGRFGTNLYADVEELISQIEHRLGIGIAHPAVLGGLFGLDTSRGILELRHFYAIHAVWRMRKILGNRDDISVCEIGSGIGITAHFAHRIGIGKYTIFDLPYVAVMAGYYLIKSLPQAEVVLYGEKADQNKTAIGLYPYWHFDKAEDKCFDLTLNQDSFPEIDADLVNSYLELMPHKTKGFFLSINQEGQGYFDASGKKQLFVPALLRDRKAYELVYRFPYWLREGYTEELYRIVE
jgi:hypothetical protein